MRCTIGIVALALIICPGPVDAGTPQPTAVMTISGIPGQFTVQVGQTDWSQIQGMPDPRTSLAAGTSSLLSSRPGSPLTSRGGGGGARSGEVGMQDLTVTKNTDLSSPELASSCAAGKHIPSVTLEIRPTGGRTQEYLVIELTNVIVEGINTGGTTDEGRPTENVTFNYQKLHWEYRPAGTEQRPTPHRYSYTPIPR
jgi:type VI protein secretion system component Hcp